MAKRQITTEDIEKDPSLVDKGYAVGDEHDFPEEEVTSEETKDNEKTPEVTEKSHGNGGNHPPGDPGKP
jgi:hypothetical protein